MQQVGLIADSSASLPVELVERYGIQIVPLQFVAGGRSYVDVVGVHTGPGLLAVSFYAGR